MTKLALIGTGWAAKAYAELKSDKFKIECVIGHSLQKTKKFAYNYSIPYYSDKKEEIHKDIKGVIICTPPQISTEISKYFLNNNYDVLIEKPGAVSSDKLNELINYEDSNRAFLAYQLRYDDNILLAKQIIEDKKIGDIDNTYFRMFFPGIRKDKESYRKWSIGRNSPSIWIESGVHLIDLATWIMGEKDDIKVLNTKYNEQSISGTAIIRHNNGGRSTIDVSFCGGENNIRGLIEFYSKKGIIQINRGTYLNKKTFFTAENNGKILATRDLAKENGILNQTIAFARWCNDRKVPMQVDLKRGVEILKIAEEIEKDN